MTYLFTGVKSVTQYAKCPWRYRIELEPHAVETIGEAIERIPGATLSRNVLTIPQELLPKVLGAPIQYTGPIPDIENAKEYQLKAIHRALSNAGNGGWLFNDEMGVGKTGEALSVVRHRIETTGECRSVLIVVPVNAVRDWCKRHIPMWYPRLANIMSVVTEGEREQQTKAKRAEFELAKLVPCVLTTYGLLPQIAKYRKQFDIVVFDECHRLQTYDSKQSNAAREITSTYRYGLTGTPIPDKARQIWPMLDNLWPQRFGKVNLNKRGCFKFDQYYFHGARGEYGWVYGKLKRETATELSERIAAVSSRTTKHDYPELFKTGTFERLEVEDKKSETDAYGNVWSSIKESTAIEWAEDAKESNTHTCVLTVRRATAWRLAQKIKGSMCFDGTVSPAKRAEMIEKFRATGGVLVCTAGSVEEAIDLTCCSVALMVETPWRLKTLVQVAGRFNRLTSTSPTTMYLLIQLGTVDETRAERVCAKFEQVSALQLNGASEDACRSALDISEKSIEEFRRQWAEGQLRDGESELKEMLE